MSSNYDKGKADKGDQDDSSGQGGKIEFHDFVTGTRSLRDDQLPHDELKRLLAIHNDGVQDRVKKQKELRDVRKQMKEGKKLQQNISSGLSAGLQSQYPPHPILSSKLRGADPKVNPNPSENIAQTNEANRNELQHRYQLQHQPQLKPGQQFHPKPQR